MLEAKQIEQKCSFDDVLFTMTSFPAKKSGKTILLGEKKKLKMASNCSSVKFNR